MWCKSQEKQIHHKQNGVLGHARDNMVIDVMIYILMKILVVHVIVVDIWILIKKINTKKQDCNVSFIENGYSVSEVVI